MKIIPVILGPTASGKSTVALEVAAQLGADIISVDSMKVYRGMDIGTDKPSPEVTARVCHHLIDIRNPDEAYSTFEFFHDCCRILEECLKAERTVILEGGTALYYRALLKGLFAGPEADWELRQQLEQEAASSGDPDYLYQKLAGLDPARAEKLHRNDHRRLIRAIEVFQLSGQPMSELEATTTRPAPFEFHLIGLDRSREQLYQRVNQRVDEMVADGLFEEVEALQENFEMSREARQGLGYKEVLAALNGDVSRDETIDRIKQSTRHFAKHQLTWFRTWDITWLQADEANTEELTGQALRIIGGSGFGDRGIE
ncbi:tRNA (adenosine(37)-N6)-dimethylallyltransferase MiaA [Planctomycetota bacterium]